jgi:hypothetical protein
VKFALINELGAYASDPYIVNVVDAPGGGGNNQVSEPQRALAVSLLTDRRGPTGKGRFYLPMVNHSIDGNSLLANLAEITATQAALVDLVNNVNNLSGLDQALNNPDVAVVVASSKGYNTEVTKVRVGRVIDTIRSRRTSVLENYLAPSAVSP